MAIVIQSLKISRLLTYTNKKPALKLMLLINRKTHTDTHAGSHTVASTKYHATGNFCRHPAELANVLKAAVEYIFCLHVLISPPPPPPPVTMHTQNEFDCHLCDLMNDMTCFNFLSLNHMQTQKCACTQTHTSVHTHTQTHMHARSYLPLSLVWSRE